MLNRAPIFFVVTASLAFWTWQPLAAQTPVRTAPVEKRLMQQRHQVTGSIRAVARGDLAALESGRLLQLLPKAGQAIKKGDVIGAIDARRLNAQRKEVVASLEVAKADLVSRKAIADRANSDLSRAQRLVSQNAVSRQEYDSANADARIAAAAILAAEREIERIQQSMELIDVRLGDAQITAPYDAKVVQRHAEPGDWVQPGETLLTLVSTGPVEAWLEVPERYVESLEAYGNDVSVRARAISQNSKVLSTRRIADVNRRVRTVSFIATLENSGGLLTPGMSVDGWIAVTGQKDEISVPKDALIRNNGATYVYRVNESSKTEQISVRVLFETSRRIAIAAQGLEPGDQLVTEGNERMLPGTAVTVTKDTAEQAVLASR